MISTALVFNAKAPNIVSREMVEAMRPGSVFVDVAASDGGNCPDLTVPDRTYTT